MGEEIEAEARAHAARIGHVHVADAPGRHEPGTGRVDYGRFFAALAATEYDGWVGLEFRPLGDHGRAVAGTLGLIP